MVEKFSFVHRVERCIERIEEYNPRVNAMLTDLSEHALNEAFRKDEAAARGEWPGLLYGLPVSVKDCIDVEGVRTTFGSGAFLENVAAEDAAVVAKAKAAGTVIMGKDNLNEWCYGGTTQNDHFGICRNPWDTTRIPGGSSGGTAASVAAGMAAVGFGSDTGGSVRMPAALCGLAGLRPTLGRLSNTGTVSVASRFDTVGPMAYSVLDVARAFAATAGYDPRDPVSEQHPMDNFLPGLGDTSLAGLRVGIPTSFFYENIMPDVAACVGAALRQLERMGATLVDVSLPDAMSVMPDAALVTAAEVAYRHKDRIEHHPETIGPEVLRRMKTGLEVKGVDMAAALDRLTRWSHRVRQALQDPVDLIATPTAPMTAPLIAQSGDMIKTTRRLLSLTYTFSPAAVPALTVPCGFDSDGLPVGMQLVGAPFDEAGLLRAGSAFQRLTDFHRNRPGKR